MVATVAAKMLTMLFPINIAASTRLKSSAKRFTLFARLLPASANARIRTRLKEENAVSAAVKEAYKKARASGDEKVAFLNGAYVLPETMRDLCSADGEHLNDLGQYFLAKAYYEVLSALLAG